MNAIITTEEEILKHSYDCWPVAAKWEMQGKNPHRPDGVVYPQTTEEVVLLVKKANEEGLSLIPWGAGSSVTGQALPTDKGGITVDMSQMNQILGINEKNLFVKVEAGVMGHHLEAYLNEKGYTLNHSPQSIDKPSAGGWVATFATGQFSSRYGGIEDLLVSLKVVLPTGEVVENKLTPRTATGIDIRGLFIGAEGTLGITTEVTLKIFPIAEHRILETITFADVKSGLAAIEETIRRGVRPFLIRYYDVEEARHAMVDQSFDQCVFFLGCEGIEKLAKAEFDVCVDIAKSHGGERIGPAGVEAWMNRRYDFSTVENILAKEGGFAECIEIADMWTGINELHSVLKERLDSCADEVMSYFSHVYMQGTSMYMILLGQAESDAAAEEALLKIWDITMKTCLELGATVSHHHGSGLARLPYILEEKQQGNVQMLVQKIKSALDPNHIMNPGKLGLTT